jgi:hypothetical protein
MSNLVRFLESVGRHPATVFSRPTDYIRAVASLDVDEAQRLALLNRDSSALGSLLNARTEMICAICTPDDEQGAVPDEGDVDGDGVPDGEPQPTKE